MAAYRSSHISQIRPTAPVQFDLLSRVLLSTSIVLALRRTEESGIRLRRQGWILRLMLASLAATAASGIATVAARPPQTPGPWWRTAGLASVSLTLLALNPIPVSLSFRKSTPGYNSASSANSSAGAGA